jgi:hypothetical protein
VTTSSSSQPGRPARSAGWLKPKRAAAIAASAALVSGITVAGASMASAASTASPQDTASSSSCQLGNGVKHVVNLVFDNVHFFRDNPNVPSDFELMPNLLNFFKGNGTILSNNHTPLIAHTSDDILSTESGIYGDRFGQPIGNSFKVYNADGPAGTFNTTDPASAFAYWTAPINDTAKSPNAAHDTLPAMDYSPVPPATANPPVQPGKVAPAPWAPFTRAGCDFGAVATANEELENTGIDLPTVFGANSPEVAQFKADTDSFHDQETADYVGVAVHCAQASATCGNATAVKFGQTTATPSASPDLLADEPGGYNGFTGLFGHKYVAPALGAGTPNLTRNGSQVTNAAGNLVDLNGNQINGAFQSTPGFPGFGGINASQTLAYLSDMLESGIPVVTGYISDLHGNDNIPGLSACVNAPAALGSGSPCYIQQAQYYNAAFGAFFARLAKDGITPQNTLFVVSPDEGDHMVGANVGRAIQPTPANCDGATVSGATVTADVPCTYPAGSFGELSGNITGLLATQKGNTTPFTLENDSAPEFYVTGNPGPNDPKVRQLERDVAGLTASNPYAGDPNQPVTRFIADPVEEGILHMTDVDPARTPTFADFANPDYFLSAGAASCPAAGCVTQNTGFAWDHGDYSAEINTDYVGFAGPGVKNLGVDGLAPAQGPSSAGPDSGLLTVVDTQRANPGPWTDTTDIRTTELHVLGLRDDYQSDGQVVSSILTDVPAHLRSEPVQQLAGCYKQLNSSVGEFGAATLVASTKAAESTTPGDLKYKLVNAGLLGLEKARDTLAGKIKVELTAAANAGAEVRDPHGQLVACEGLITAARALAAAA